MRRLILIPALFAATALVSFAPTPAGASAATLHECSNTGGNQSGTGIAYSDSGCSVESATGEYETVPISGTQSVTSTSTSSFTLHGEAAGVAVNVVCESMMSGEGTTATNEEVEGEMTASGEGTTEFSGCEATEPEGCTVAEPIVTVLIKAHTEDGAEEKHYVKYEPAPEGETVPPFVELNFSNCKNKLVNGKKAVNGVLRSESTSSATQSFTSESGSEVTFVGHPATLSGSYHLSTPDGTALRLGEAPSPSPTGATLHECIQASGTGTSFSDSLCSKESAEGTFQTAPLKGTREIEATSTSSFSLHGEASGVSVAIDCESMQSSEGTVANEEVGGEMTAHGAGVAELGGCQSTEPAGCTVAEAMETAELVGHSSETSVEFEPKEGEALLTIELTGCTNEAIDGSYAVKGTARSEATSTRTQVFNETSGSELEFAGHSARLAGSYHLSTPGGTPVYLEEP